MSQSPSAIDRAREDLAAPRPWKARERLRAYLKAFPLDADARNLLGQTLYDMGDLPAAGAVWLLSERDDDATRAAIEALRREHGSRAAFRSALDVRAPIEAWPPAVQERLRALQAQAARDGETWEPNTPRDDDQHDANVRSSPGDKLVLAGCLAGGRPRGRVLRGGRGRARTRARRRAQLNARIARSSDRLLARIRPWAEGVL